MGVYGSRNLTEWDLGTNYASATFDFVPTGAFKPAPRDVVRDADCNKCHDVMQFHGGSRVGVAICIMCHQPQTADPNTGNSLDMKVFIHALHMGADLPTVVAGGKYQIYGHNGYSDYSDVHFPSTSLYEPLDCAGTCHNPKNGAAQTNAWLTGPTPRGVRRLPQQRQLRHRPESREPAADGRQPMRAVPHPAGRLPNSTPPSWARTPFPTNQRRSPA